MDAAIRTCARTARALVCVTLIGYAILLTGCVLGEPDAPLSGDPIPVPEPPPSAIPTTAPDSPDILIASGEMGEPVTAGAWQVVLRDAEPLADDGLRVVVELTNTSADALRFTPGDLTMIAEGRSIFPSEGVGHDLGAVRDVPPGDTIPLTGIFNGVTIAEDRSATLVFAPAEGGPVRIEIEVTGA